MKKYKIIDAHCHIYPDKIAQRAADSTGDFYDLTPFSDGKISSLLEMGEKFGIDHFVVHLGRKIARHLLFVEYVDCKIV